MQLTNPVTVPRLDEMATANWVAGSVSSTLSSGSFAVTSLTPHVLTVFSQWEKELLFSSSPSIDKIVSRDIASLIAAEVDRVAIQGAGGVSAEPLGILGTASVNTVAFGADGLALQGSTLALDFCASLEEAIATDNADTSAMGWIVHPTERRRLRSTPMWAGGPPIWGSDNKLLGYNT